MNLWKNSVSSITDLAEYYFNEGNLKESEKIFIMAEPLIQLNSCPNEYKAVFYFSFGKLNIHLIFYKAYPPDKGLEILNKGLKFLDKEKNLKLYSKFLDQQGMGIYFKELFKIEPNFSEAKNVLQEALNIRKNLNDFELTCETLFRLGLIEEQSGNFDNAMDLYNDSYNIAKENNFHLEQSYSARHIAFIKLRNNEKLNALNLMLESKNLRTKVGFKPGNIFSNISLGDIYTNMQDFKNAEIVLMEAYETSLEYGIERGIMLSSLSLGELFKIKEQIELSKKYFIEALSIAKSMGHEKAMKFAEKMINELEITS
jgi:tetratricopeptide (TPR) repeat protein